MPYELDTKAELAGRDDHARPERAHLMSAKFAYESFRKSTLFLADAQHIRKDGRCCLARASSNRPRMRAKRPWICFTVFVQRVGSTARVGCVMATG